LLRQAIKEGACDFITELVIGKLMQNNYIVYGREHETELKEQFKEMFTPILPIGYTMAPMQRLLILVTLWVTRSANPTITIPR
jgi:hypothetical protein